MARPCIVVMGVSGCGKSTIGRALAERLGLPFVEGDELHPLDNVRRMAAGIALSDEDRQGWLHRVAHVLRQAAQSGQGVVVSCSALRRTYRDLLRQAAPDLRLVHLQGPPDVLRQRLAARQGHYMPATLLPSQLSTLEPPGQDEAAMVLDIESTPDTLVRSLHLRLEKEIA